MSAVVHRRALHVMTMLVLALVGVSGCASSPAVDSTGPEAPEKPLRIVDTVGPEWRELTDCGPTGREARRGDGIEPAEEGIRGVLRFDDPGDEVVEGCPRYEIAPPIGGPHSDRAANCGFYTSPVPAPAAVHSMRNGAVWITYDPALPEADLRTIERATVRAGHILASPYPGLSHPVVLSAWRRQLALDSVDDSRFDEFLDVHVQGHQTVDEGGPCHEGLGRPHSRFR